MAERSIHVRLSEQRLRLLEDGSEIRAWPVSTAAQGAGEKEDSLKTPRGAHVVRAKIGAGAPEGAVFEGRRPTGEICTAEAYRAEPARDWILTRILWLSGLEAGRNRGLGVDTMRRFIYIHGTPDATSMGVASSHGCIRMRNRDAIELFALVDPGTHVEIEE